MRDQPVRYQVIVMMNHIEINLCDAQIMLDIGLQPFRIDFVAPHHLRFTHYIWIADPLGELYV
jgi:hypothetical protein